MKEKQIENFLLSAMGVGVVLLIVIGINVLGGFFKWRMDLTEDDLFTLSEGTQEILTALDTTVSIRFYHTRDDRIMPVPFKAHARRVLDMLDELKLHGGENIEIRELDPEPFSDDRNEATADGMIPARLDLQQDQFYLGLAVTMLDKTVSIPYLDPSRAAHLEYDIIRAITQVSTTDSTVIGVMSTLPVLGQAPNPMMGPQGGSAPAWQIFAHLQKDYEVREIDATVEDIEEDIDILIVVHPKDLTDGTLFAIDQFLLGGGKLMALLDSQCLADPSGGSMGFSTTPSNLDALLSAWGLEFSSDQVVADKNMMYPQEVAFRQGAEGTHQPAFLLIDANGINQEDVLTEEIQQLLIPLSGFFSGEPVEGISRTVLAHSTTNSQPVGSIQALMSGNEVNASFRSDNRELPLIVRLNGTFPSAFPEGRPGSEEESEEDIDSEETPSEEEETPSLTTSSQPGTVILTGDVDFLLDNISFEIRRNIFGQRSLVPHYGNAPLFLNMVEQLTGSEQLIRVRSRTTERPFTRIREMKSRAEERFRSRIDDLKAKQEQTMNKINELQNARKINSIGQALMFTPEQQAEFRALQELNDEVEKELYNVNRQLRQDVDRLENSLKVVNIGGMAFLVTLLGVSAAVIKRRRTAAR